MAKKSGPKKPAQKKPAKTKSKAAKPKASKPAVKRVPPTKGGQFGRTGGTARRYIHPETGAEISRRQFDKYKKAKGIYKPVSQARHRLVGRKQSTFKSLRDDYIARQASFGRKLSKRQAEQDPQFRRNMRMLKTDSQEQKRKALIGLGRRSGVPDWVPVGQSEAFLKGVLNLPKDSNAGVFWRFKKEKVKNAWLEVERWDDTFLGTYGRGKRIGDGEFASLEDAKSEANVALGFKAAHPWILEDEVFNA